MWYVPTPEGDVDLEGTRVLHVARSPGRIEIKVANARYVRENLVVIPYALLVCQNVKSEEAAVYIGTGVKGEVTDLAIPVDDLEVVEFSGTRLELHGYKAHKPWYVWSIDCDAVQIEIRQARSAT